MISICYKFTMNDGSEELFDIELDETNLMVVSVEKEEELPNWTQLEFNKCANCTLNEVEHSHCPLASKLVDVVLPFERLVSYDTIHVEITTAERVIAQETTVQKALSSLMGLIMATSGCPHTSFFRSMARFHQPLSGLDESMFRAISSYLLAQYFMKREGMEIDFDLNGLKKIYHEMHVVNQSIVKRLAAASKTDSSLNGLVKLDMYTKAVPIVIEQSLKEMLYLFEPIIEQVKQNKD